MVKLSGLRNSSWRRSKNVIFKRMTLEQLQEKQMRELNTSLDRTMKTIDSKSETIREEMAKLGTGVTNYNSYCDTEGEDVETDTIVFPLVRTSEDWEARSCWIRDSGGSEKCLHFPCRTFTSYHFIFRDLPKFVEDAAAKSVRRSKYQRKTSVPCSSVDSEDEVFRKRQEYKLPPIILTDNMTIKEWKLKMLTEKKRLHNDAKNRPKDRNVNYGAPTPVRQIQKPARPAIRRIETR